MAKTWETLFNLTGFMKYLLAEVLPDEKVEAPTYILESLYDLVSVTVACIDKVKSGSKNKIKSKFPECSVDEILLSRTNITNNHLKNASESINSLPEKIINPRTSGLLSTEDFVVDNGITNTKSLAKPISEEFIKLSEEMHKGRPFGHYCRPCDSIFLNKKKWDEHNSDKLHIFLKEHCEIKHSSCSYCNLIIFASFEEAQQLFCYHQKQHFISQSSLPNSAVNENMAEAPLIDKSISIETKSGIGNNGSFNCLLPTPTISSVFLQLDQLMHSGNERGFFCQTCDKAYDAVVEWNEHFQKEEAHTNPQDETECFEMCESCKLVIYANPSKQILYKAYHMRGHNSNRNKKSRSSRRSSENLAYRNHNESHTSQEGKSTNFRGVPYIIADQFKIFNKKVHSDKLRGYCYCRPCNVSLSPEEWEKHSNERKHLDLMSSRKYKNFKGKCSYCLLTIVGTRETVKYYMDHHNKDHQKVLSYNEERISCNYPMFSKRGVRGGKRVNKRRAPSANSVSTAGDEEESEDSDEEDEDTVDSESVSVCGSEGNRRNDESDHAHSSSNAESSWYAPSKEEQQHFMVFKLVNSRKEQKEKMGTAAFGALCIICEETFESGFDWHDHLESLEHCKNISSKDRQAKINDLNIVLFGNSDVLEKYKSIVKGNMTFL